MPFKEKTMTQDQAQELIAFLTDSFLVKEQGLTLAEAADVYDDMNGDTEYADALKETA
jgi:hypothetical protein